MITIPFVNIVESSKVSNGKSSVVRPGTDRDSGTPGGFNPL